LAEKLWQWRWSLLKKPSNLSVEEKQAIAELESEDEGFVHCFAILSGNWCISSITHTAKPKRSADYNS
jgi:hypothetical protein